MACVLNLTCVGGRSRSLSELRARREVRGQGVDGPGRGQPAAPPQEGPRDVVARPWLWLLRPGTPGTPGRGLCSTGASGVGGPCAVPSLAPQGP